MVTTRSGRAYNNQKTLKKSLRHAKIKTIVDKKMFLKLNELKSDTEQTFHTAMCRLDNLIRLVKA